MSGPPKKPTHLKILAGTQRADREPAPASELLPDTLDQPPEAPDWLPNAHAKNEWDKCARILLERKALTEGALTVLAHYCAMHGNMVRTLSAGANVQASIVDTMRKMAKDLGLTGNGSNSDDDGPKKNKFSNNGRRKS